MRTLFIFFLTFIVDLSYMIFWVAAFLLACGWQQAYVTIVNDDQQTGFGVLFACVASVVVPLFMAAVFGAVLFAVNKKN